MLHQYQCSKFLGYRTHSKFPTCHAISPSLYDIFFLNRMHIVWHKEFNRWFSKLNINGEQWILKPTDIAPQELFRWSIFKDSAKVRFTCYVSLF